MATPNEEKQAPQESRGSGDPTIDALRGLVDLEGVQDVEQKEQMWAFSGAWLPNVDPVLLGPENFQSLINMRYTDRGIKGVNGYEFRNDTAITTYTDIVHGHHLKTDNRTTTDHTLVHAATAAGGAARRIYVNNTAIGSVGDFATSIGEQAAGSRGDYLWEDSANDLDGKFSRAPGGSVAFCNGYESLIWNGYEMDLAAAFTTTSSAEANPVDVTEKTQNARTDSKHVFTWAQASRPCVTIMTTRPIHGIKIYVSSANITAATTMTVKYWNGSAYAAVSNLSDGTASGGITLAQTGWVTFDSTVTTCKLHHFQERFLYAYQLEIDGGSADISQITVEAPMQAPSNVWDGVYRTPIQCQLYDSSASTYEDFTLHVAESSTVNTPVGAILDGMQTSGPDYLYFMFDEPMAGVKVIMLGNLVNTASSTIQVQYWDGSAWQNLTEVDGTSGFSTSGAITWNLPSDEEKTTLFGTQGYGYRLYVTGANVSDATAGKGTEDVVIDLLTGIPSPKDVPVFKFPAIYKSKLFLCNYELGNQGNRIDYSVDNAPDVFNGESSSLDGFQSIYVGGSENLTCATQLYNRFGSNLFSSLALFKDNEIYLLTGESPIDYQLFPVSFTIGCPAPDTLVTAEVGFELGENVARNVAIFCSNSGPMMYDGAVLYPLRGVETYFDPSSLTNNVNYDALQNSYGWFDSFYREYNLQVPINSSTTPNLWLVYDMVRKKWYRKDNGSGDKVYGGWNVSAENGDQYVYGGTKIGKIVQHEKGTAWGSSPIDNEVQTADIFPSGSEWDITHIRRLKFVCKRTIETDKSVQWFSFLDTNGASGLRVVMTDATATYTNSGTAGLSFADVDAADADSGVAGLAWSSSGANSIDISVSGDTRLVRVTEILNQTGWTHSFKFVYSSSTTTGGFTPLMWGVQFNVQRKDY